MPGKPTSPTFRIVPAALTFVLLFTVAIPWWWQFVPQLGERVILGAPVWFLSAVVGSFITSIVTARSLQRAWDWLEQSEEWDEESGHDEASSGDTSS